MIEHSKYMLSAHKLSHQVNKLNITNKAKSLQELSIRLKPLRTHTTNQVPSSSEVNPPLATELQASNSRPDQVRSNSEIRLQPVTEPQVSNNNIPNNERLR